MHWGKWIIISYALFALFIATLVLVCMRQDVSLVSKNYYQEELVYDQQMLRLQNTANLAQKPEILLDERGLLIRFQPRVNVENCTLALFCPANPDNDCKMIITPSASGEHIVSVRSVNPGMYHARLSWSVTGKKFYLDKVITL